MSIIIGKFRFRMNNFVYFAIIPPIKLCKNNKPRNVFIILDIN